MTIREIITRVKSAYNRGVGSDDSRLRNRLVYNMIKTAYGDVLNDPRIQIKVTDFSRATIDCVPLKETTPYECDCIPALGCRIYRSEDKIPRPAKSGGTLQFGPVRTIDGRNEFSVLGLDQSTHVRHLKYAADVRRAFVKNDYLYVESPSEEEVVSVTMVPIDPFAVAEFKTYCQKCTTAPCTSILDAEFNMEEDVADKVVKMAIDEIFRYMGRIRSDDTNDGTDDREKA